MFSIFKSEFLRYRWWIIGLALVHIGLWALVYITSPILQAQKVITFACFLAAIAGGFLFGALQMGLYKRANDWCFLVQRPLAVHKIYLALIAAAFVSFALIVFVPYTLIIVLLDSATNTLVDARHYQTAAFICLITFAAYLGGCFARIHPSKAAFLATSFVSAAVISKPAPAWILFALVLATILWLGYICYKAFKPNLDGPIAGVLNTFLIALPIIFGIAGFTVFITVPTYHIPLMIVDKHPDNHPVAQSYDAFIRMNDVEAAMHLLEKSEHADIPQLIGQLELLEFEYIPLSEISPTLAGQMYFQDKSYALENGKTNESWIFSHDKMLLQGINNTSGEISGWLGRNGFLSLQDNIEEQDRFTYIPFLVANQFVVGSDYIARVDFTDKTFQVIHRAPDGERYVSKLLLNKADVVIASESHLYIFDKQRFLQQQGEVEADFRISHPVPYSNIGSINAATLLDGHLLIYQGEDYFGRQQAGAEALLLSLGSKAESLTQIKFTAHKHPTLIGNWDIATSPLSYVINNVVYATVLPSEAQYKTWSEIINSDYTTTLKFLILFFGLSSMTVILFLARTRNLTNGQKALWALLAICAALPAAIAFIFIHSKPDAIPKAVQHHE